MKKNYIILVPITIIIICIIGIFTVASNGEITIKDLDIVIDVDSQGDMNVRETWLVNWPAGKSVSFRDIGYEKYKEGNPLYQDRLNTASFNKNVVVEVYDKNNLKLNKDEYRVGFSFNKDKDELGHFVECYPNQKNCESIFIQVYGGMQSQMTFVYEYKIEGAITKYSDVAELNWNILQYFGSKVNRANVVINIPTTPKEDIYAWGHGLSDGFVKINNNQVALEIENIRSNDFLEFRILFPSEKVNVRPQNQINREMFSTIREYEDKIAIETNKQITVAKVIYYGSFIMLAGMVLVFYYIYKKYDKEFVSDFNNQYYRELPKKYSPAEMSYLYYFRKINNEDLTATVLDLIRRKYLSLDTDGESVNQKKPSFKLRLENKNFQDLLPHEKHLINWFFGTIGSDGEVSLKQIEQYPKTNYLNANKFNDDAATFVRLAKESGRSHDFFISNSEKSKAYGFIMIPLVYLIISLFTAASYSVDNMIAIVISISLIIGLVSYIPLINKRSKNGNEDYVRWKAFRNFLNDFSNMKDHPMPSVVVWEHYLVYATSLKIADKVMDQLKVRLPELEKSGDINKSTYFYFSYRYYGFNIGYTLGSLNNTFTTARNNSFTTIQKHNSQRVGVGGSSGRGGGFGGGSSFGGGGGGFRGR